LLKPLDEDLYDKLIPFKNKNYRKIENIEGSNILPEKTHIFRPHGYSEYVPDSLRRQEWHEKALRELHKVDFIFLDPDNMLEISSKPFSIEHVRVIELEDYSAEGKSVIFYNHRPRFENPINFNERFSVLNRRFEHGNIRGIRTPRGGQRDYCFIIRPEHSTINKQLDKFLEKWKDHFSEVTND
jgi:hypothetical protein